MAKIGTLGDVVFEVSADTIRTFDNYNRKTTARLATHDIIGKKPVVEFLGPGIDDLSFTMKLHAFYGVKPKEEITGLREMCDTGKVVNLIVNGAPVTENKWVVESVEERANTFDSKGNLISADVSVALKEYVENA